MGNEKERFANRLIAPLELMFTFLALLVPGWMSSNSLVITKEIWILAFALGPFAFYLFSLFNVSRVLRVTQYATLIINYFIISSLCTVYLFVAVNVLDLTTVGRLEIFAFYLLSFIFLLGTKLAFYSAMRGARSKGLNQRHALIYADESSMHFIDMLLENRFWGFNITFFITESDVIKERYKNIAKFLDPNELDLITLLDNNQIDEVFYCRSEFNQDKIEDIVRHCMEVGVVFRVESHLLSFFKSKSTIRYFETIPFFTVQTTPSNQFHMWFKHAFDRTFSFFLLLFLSPVFVVLAILIKLDSKGPVFFLQERVGRMGRKFKIFKFRTMVQNAEEIKKKLQDQNEKSGPVFKIKNDPRITKLGRFLRKTSLDELPQFLNVLMGHMSIVGPRPPIQSEVDKYERWQRRRLSMKPGITCIWQVSGRNNIEFEEWMQMDLEYIDSWSLKLDLMLFIKTIGIVFKGDGQ